MLRLLALAFLAPAFLAAGARPVQLGTAPNDAPANNVSSGASDALFCSSWMFSVESGNAGPWHDVPKRCIASVQEYIEGGRYASDCEVVAQNSLAFATQALANGDGGEKPAWVFDLDETLLSNAATETYKNTSRMQILDAFDDTQAPAMPSTLKLYNALLELGFHIFITSGRSELQREATEAHLLAAGYHSWEKFIFRQVSDFGKPGIQFKPECRAAIEAEGFKIVGNSGDQWSDLLGSPVPMRSFKLPNPMYYLP